MLAPQFRWWASLVGGDGSGWDVGGEMWDKVVGVVLAVNNSRRMG